MWIAIYSYVNIIFLNMYLMEDGCCCMLSDYNEEQELAYNLLVRDIENNCVTHAYLIDENDYSDSFNMVISFVKL